MFPVNGLYTVLINGLNGFQAANPGAGIPNGTEITAPFLNDVEFELLNVLIKAGVAPAQNTPNQVIQSLIAMMRPSLIWVSTSQTVPMPAWMTRCRFWGWSGGASGGVPTSTGERGGGGGAGAFAFGEGPVSSASFDCTIGVGGAGVTSGDGNPGSETACGLFTLQGGSPGAGTSDMAGGQTGSGVLANPLTGYVGGLGDGTDGNISGAQPGGNGGGPGGGRGADGQNGFPGTLPGAGGGGSNSGQTSGAGANGLIILEPLP